MIQKRPLRNKFCSLRGAKIFNRNDIVAINFNDKILVTNPTAHFLGRGVFCVGIIAIAVGVITYFTGDILLPALAWCALGVPTVFIGWILMKSGLTKN